MPQPRHPAAATATPAQPHHAPPTPDRFRVLFVGMDLNPISIAVLDTLTRLEGVEVRATVSRKPGMIGRAWRQYGWRTVLGGAGKMVRARSRMLLRRFGLKRTTGFRSLAEVAAARGLELRPFESINATETIEDFRSFRPDLLLVAACEQILKAPVLAIPRVAAVNVHPSLLPAYRGPKPCYWVLQEGQARTGVTFHRIDEGIDTGAILAQRELEITSNDTEIGLRQRCGLLAGEMAGDVVRGVRDGTLEPRPQDESLAGYRGKPPWGRSRM